MTRTTRRHLGIGTWMALVSLSAMMPMVLTFLGLTWVRQEEQRALLLERLQRQAETLAAAVDADLQRDITLLNTIALSPAARRQDWPLVHEFAQRAVAAEPLLAAISVTAPDGRMLLHTQAAIGAALPASRVAGQDAALYADGRTLVSPMLQGAYLEQPVVGVAVPLRDADGRIGHALRATLRPAGLSERLASLPLPPAGIAAVIDQRMTIVARSTDAERWAGQPATPSLQALLRGPAGQVGESMTRDGRLVYTAAAPVGNSGWRLVLGVPVDALQAERQREFGTVLVLGVPLTLLGVLLSFALGRRLAQQIRAAALGETGDRRGVHEVVRLSERVDAARRDALTGLPNRAAWTAHAGQLLGEGRCAGVLFIDLDGFKAINDTHGHEAGDRALQAVAGVLRAVLRGADLAGRFGGDEFVVAVGQDDAAAGAPACAAVAARIQRGVAALGQGLGCSIGVALPRKGEPLAAMLDRADQAMLRAKQAGKNRVETDES